MLHAPPALAPPPGPSVAEDVLVLTWPAACTARERPPMYFPTRGQRPLDPATRQRAQNAVDRLVPGAELCELPPWRQPCASFAVRRGGAVHGLQVPYVATADTDPNGARARQVCAGEARAAAVVAACGAGPAPTDVAPDGSWYLGGDRGVRLGGAEAQGPLARRGLRLLWDLHHGPAPEAPPGPPGWLDGLDAAALARSEANVVWPAAYRQQMVRVAGALTAALAEIEAAAPLEATLHGEFSFQNIAVVGPEAPGAAATAPAVQLLASAAMRRGDPTCDLAHYAAWCDWPPAELPALLRAYRGDVAAPAAADPLLPRLRLRLCLYLLKRHAVSITFASRSPVSPYAGWRLQQALALAAGDLRQQVGLTLRWPAASAAARAVD